MRHNWPLTSCSTRGCSTVQTQDSLGHLVTRHSTFPALIFPRNTIIVAYLVAWVHQKAYRHCITFFCTVSAGKMHRSRDMKVRVVMFRYIIFSPVLTDDPGDEAEADHGDDPGGQQTLHGGVWRPRCVTMSQSCHDNVTQQQQCHGVTTRRPGWPNCTDYAGRLGRAGCRVQTVHCTAAL